VEWVKVQSDLLFTAISTLVLGIVISFHASKMPWSCSGIPGPAVFPLIIGVALILLSVANIVLSLTGRSASPGKTSAKERFKALWIIGVSVAYFLLLKPIGFVVLTPIYVICLIAGLIDWVTVRQEKVGAKVVVEMILLGGAVTAAVFLVFAKVFLVSLP
jgi:hypothetical protein